MASSCARACACAPKRRGQIVLVLAHRPVLLVQRVDRLTLRSERFVDAKRGFRGRIARVLRRQTFDFGPLDPVGIERRARLLQRRRRKKRQIGERGEFGGDRVEPREMSGNALRAPATRNGAPGFLVLMLEVDLPRSRFTNVSVRRLQRIGRDDGVAQLPLGRVVEVERGIKRLGAGPAGREKRVRLRVEPVAEAIERAERGGAGGERFRQRTAGAQQRLAALAQRALAQTEFGFECPAIHAAERSAQL